MFSIHCEMKPNAFIEASVVVLLLQSIVRENSYTYIHSIQWIFPLQDRKVKNKRLFYKTLKTQSCIYSLNAMFYTHIFLFYFCRIILFATFCLWWITHVRILYACFFKILYYLPISVLIYFLLCFTNQHIVYIQNYWRCEWIFEDSVREYFLVGFRKKNICTVLHASR